MLVFCPTLRYIYRAIARLLYLIASFKMNGAINVTSTITNTIAE